MRLLHKKVAYECNEDEWEEHIEEIEKYIDVFAKVPEYECLFIMRYVDEAHKMKNEPIYELGNIRDVFEMTEYFNISNGCDLTINHEGYLSVNVYGHLYEHKVEDKFKMGIETVEIRVIPFDKNSRFIDLSNFLITEGKEPITYARNQTSYSSLIMSVRDEQYMEQSTDDFISVMR